MVDTALSIGAAVGVLFSAGFVYWEVGRYASPQVPESRFDERKEMISYTAGLFAGIPLAVCLLLLFDSFPDYIGGIAIYLAALVGGTELAQWAILRTAYFGRDGAMPFYALGLRVGIGGILGLALITQYLSGPSLSPAGIAGPVCDALAIVLLEGVGAILSLPATGERPIRRGGPISGAPIAVIGFFFLGYAASLGAPFAIAAPLVLALGTLWFYRAIAPPALETASFRSAPAPPAEGRLPSAFGRTRP
jgi:hypothetical protein